MKKIIFFFISADGAGILSVTFDNFR